MLNNLNATEYLPQIYVGRQINEGEIELLVKAGIKTVICNRPDGEEPGQPSFTSIEAAAKAAGLHAIYLPVTMPGLTIEAAEQMTKAINVSTKPVFAYCRSGGRVKKLCDTIKNNLL